MEKEVQQERAANSPHYLEELHGDEIVSVEIVDGGTQYCRAIRIKLKSGKHFTIDRYMDISAYGINPQLKYNIGAWFSMNVNKDKENG